MKRHVKWVFKLCTRTFFLHAVSTSHILNGLLPDYKLIKTVYWFFSAFSELLRSKMSVCSSTVKQLSHNCCTTTTTVVQLSLSQSVSLRVSCHATATQLSHNYRATVTQLSRDCQSVSLSFCQFVSLSRNCRTTVVQLSHNCHATVSLSQFPS
jgi:hypothetical protein